MHTGGHLLGREQELALLTRMADDVRRGRGGVVVVRGEPGIGKTALAESFAAQVADALDVRWVTCWESDAVPAFWPWTKLVGAVRATTPPADPRVARIAHFDTVLDRLTSIAKARPTLLVIDDLHWADADSVELLRFLAPHVGRIGTLVMVTERTGEQEPLRLGSAARALRLGALPDEALARLIGPQADPAEADDLIRRCAGNPLFALELADAGPDGSLPESVRELLQRRLRLLGERSRALVNALAVLDSDTAPALLAQLAGESVDEVLAGLDEAADANVLALRDGLVGFRHPLLREVVARGFSVAARVRGHERAADGLLAWRAAGHAVPESVIASHFVAAAPAGRAADAVRHSLAAADEAERAFAYERAARHVRDALRVLELGPGLGPSGPLWLRHGALAVAAGATAGARESFLAAAADARARDDRVLLAEAALGLDSGGGFEVSATDEEQRRLLAQALAAVGTEHPGLRARLTARLTVAAAFTEPLHTRRRSADQALALAREAADDRATFEALAAVHDAYAAPEFTENRIVWAGEMLALARVAGDVAGELLALRMLVVAHLERGDADAFDDCVGAFERAAHRLRQPLYDWYLPLWRAFRRWSVGDDAGAQRLLEEVDRIGAAAGSANAGLMSMAARALSMFDRSPTRQQVQFALDLGTPEELAPWMALLQGCGLASAGAVEEARLLLPTILAEVRALPEDSEYLASLVQAAIAAHACADRALAHEVYDRLLPHRQRMAIEGIGAYSHGSVEHYLGLLAATLGRRGEAEEHRARAEQANAAAGWRLPEGIARRTDAGPYSPNGPPAAGTGIFARAGDHWVVGLGAERVTVRHAKGMADLAALLAVPGRGVAALDLAATGEGTASRTEAGLAESGHLGEVIDARARDAYRRRITELEDDEQEARGFGDTRRAGLARAERDLIVDELTRAYGLGGRPRLAGDPGERARSTVTARIRATIGHLERLAPDLAAHLRRSIRTGRICSYEPESPVRWDLTS